MKICAVICEYNPFHNGHLYQLSQAKRLSGADAVLCIMSGNFVQRGDTAIVDKFTRAKHAVLGGADIVIELPTIFATSNAELFAKGAISILSSIPAVTTLCFGAETNDKAAFMKTATLLNEEPKEVSQCIKSLTSDGMSYAKARAIALTHMEKAKNLIASSIDKNCGWVVFNPNPATGYGTVTLPNGTCGYVENIPAKGYATVAKVKSSNTIKVGRNTMENKFFKLTFDGNMMLSSVYDKNAVREVLTEGQKGNELRIYSDYPDLYDAWEWTEYSLESYNVIDQLEKVEAIQDGIRSGLRITRHHQKSVIEQTIWLYDDIDRIDFDTRVDWHERHQMLKTAFPVDVHSDYATYDIQYGNIRRPTHKNTSWDAMKFEVCGHKFADLSEGDYGVTMFNDCKFGHDIHDGVMILSLIRGSTFPDPEADQGEMTCTYSIRPHMGALDLPKTSAMAYHLNNPLQILRATGDGSVLPEEFFVVKSDKENILCEVVKEAEDSNALILRLYEINNAKTSAQLTFGFDVASVALCDMLEKEIKPLPVQNNTVDLPFGTFEIHTLKVLPASKQ